MPRGRPRKPTHLHLIEGTYRADRHRNRLMEPGERLTGAQQALLLHAKPIEDPEARANFVDLARACWWLNGQDAIGLRIYCEALIEHREAGRILDEAMRDPEFSRPTSQAAKLGRLALQRTDKATEKIFGWSDRLGLSPASRCRLGIRLEGRPRQDDPWPAELRLRRPPEDDPA